MKTLLLRKATQQRDCPDPRTRLGLAFIAFTTENIEEPTEIEVEQVSERVRPLWTQIEVERLDKPCGDEPRA
jgi:hypothetical protein